MSQDHPLSVIECPTDVSDWSVALVVDVALGTPEQDVLEAHGLQHHHLEALKEDEFFMLQVAKLRRELQKEGVSFRLKAQLQADALLSTSWSMIHDQDVAANVRADLIKSTMRWAEYDGNKAAAAGASGGSRFSLLIDLGNSEKGVTIEGQVDDG